PRRLSSAHRSFLFQAPRPSPIYPLSLHDALPISEGFPCYGGKDNVCASALTLGSSSYEDEIAAGTVNKCTLTVSGHLLRNHSDRPEPNLHQLRPSRNWKLRAPQSKRMPALRIQMHLHGDAGVLQCDVVSQRVVYTVHVVILRLQQKCRRRLAGDMEIGIQPKLFIGERQMPRMSNYKFFGALLSIPLRRGNRQVPRIESHRKIRAAAFFVGGIHCRIQT